MNTSKFALYKNPEKVLTPEESVISMFEHTDNNGTLYISEWPYDNNCDNKEHVYQCAMNWSENDAKNVVSEYRFLYAALEEIAKKWDSINSDSDIEKLSPDLRDVWNTYLRDFETGDIDVKLVMDISDRMEMIKIVKSIAEKIKNGTKISKEESLFYNNFRGTNITEKEKAIYKAYKDAIHADVKHRIGDGIAAYDVVVSAKTLCRLMLLKVPEIIINNAANLLAQAIAIHTCCKEINTVDDVEQFYKKESSESFLRTCFTA